MTERIPTRRPERTVPPEVRPAPIEIHTPAEVSPVERAQAALDAAMRERDRAITQLREQQAREERELSAARAALETPAPDTSETQLAEARAVLAAARAEYAATAVVPSNDADEPAAGEPPNPLYELGIGGIQALWYGGKEVVKFGWLTTKTLWQSIGYVLVGDSATPGKAYREKFGAAIDKVNIFKGLFGGGGGGHGKAAHGHGGGHH